MALTTIAWLFTVGVLAHNLEEALFLPAWAAGAGPWHPPVGPREFTFAAGVLSLLLVALAMAAQLAGARSVWAYLFAGYVFAMVANVFVPHVIGSAALRSYMPGTATALLLNLPLGVLYLRRAVSERFVERRTLAWAAPLTALAILVSIPALFAVGRLL